MPVFISRQLISAPFQASAISGARAEAKVARPATAIEDNMEINPYFISIPCLLFAILARRRTLVQQGALKSQFHPKFCDPLSSLHGDP
jgi:hypothetical protein